MKKTNAALRKPPPVLQPVDPATADQFVSGRLDVQAADRLVSVPSALPEPEHGDSSVDVVTPATVQTSERSDVQTSKRSIVARADGRTLRRMTVYLPTDLAKQLAVHCAEHDRDMSEVIAASVARTLGRSDI